MGRGLQGYEVNQTQISELSQGIIGKEGFTNRKSWLSHIFFSNYETFRSKGTKSTHCNLLSFRSIYLSILVESREEFRTRGGEYDAGTMHWLI